MLETEILARIQFATTISFHYIYPPMTIGLGIIMVIMEGFYYFTKKKQYEIMTRFWSKVFALIFALGVATGIVMEFQFGTNWSAYSRFVGDIFGSALAAEGIFAFFLESGFLAILVFGWNRVKPGFHFFATIMVALGAHLSALWIIVANSWQQTPAGYHIVSNGITQRAELVDFWQVVFNPSTIERVSHTLSGCWLAGGFLVLSVAAYYLLKNKHLEFAKSSLKIALGMVFFASLFQLFTGHSSAIQVAKTQPAKLAAFEAHYDSSAAGSMYLWGWVDDENQKVIGGPAIPGMLSFLTHWDWDAPITGLNAFPKEDRPPVNVVFQTYHIMVAIGMAMIAIAIVGVFLLIRKKLFKAKWYLYILLFSVLLPHIANQLGWASAEIGRQPWIVYGLLRTKDAVSVTVSYGELLFSLILFVLIYLLLLFLFLFLLNRKIKQGPDSIDSQQPEDLSQESILEN